MTQRTPPSYESVINPPEAELSAAQRARIVIHLCVTRALYNKELQIALCDPAALTP
jgi:ABC-type protease/lipase transport system fused ATPase/permease subunit